MSDVNEKETSSVSPRRLVVETDGGLSPRSAEERSALDGIFRTLFERAGVDFSHYRQTTVMRRLSRRLGRGKFATLAEYREALRRDPQEVEQLHDDLLLSVTEYFRDQDAFEALRQNVFPALVDQHSSKSPIRIWVPGCSTGEEVYSLAISLVEYLDETQAKVSVQLFGTDVSSKNIEVARAAVYSEGISRQVSAERLKRFFLRVREGFRVSKHLREMCVFAVQDLSRDPPFANMALVSCRNVLIYFDAEFQTAAIPLFHFALEPNGFLFLGTSETLAKFPELFVAVDGTSCTFRKIAARGERTDRYRFPSVRPSLGGAPAAKTVLGGPERIRQVRDAENGRIDQLLLEQYAPPGVLIDGSLHVRQFRGRAATFLEPASGDASLRLSKLVRDDMMPDLVVAIEEVRKTRQQVKKNIGLSRAGELSAIDIAVFPVERIDTGELEFLVLFEESKGAPFGFEPVAPCCEMEPARDAEIKRLTAELASIKQYLQTMIEEKDEVNQELWATNEELQSTNEELQSVNEELEAAKEELESTNEELLALNEELCLKNAALLEEENRFRGLVESSFDWIWEADENGRYTYSSPRVSDILGYGPSEIVGMDWVELCQPRASARSGLGFGELFGATEPIVALECECRHKTGRRVLLETSGVPIRNASGAFRGFRGVHRDVTERRKAVAELRRSEESLARAQAVAMLGNWELDLVADENFWSAEMYELMGFERAEAVPAYQDFLKIVCPEDRARLEQSLSWVVANGESTRLEWQTDPARLAPKTFETHMQPVMDDAGEVVKLIGTVQDITERKRTQSALEQSEARFRSYVEAAPDAIFVVDADGRYVDLNDAACCITGYSREELLAMALTDLIEPADLAAAQQYLGRVVQMGQSVGELRFVRKSGSVGYWSLSAVRLSDSRFLGFAKDITIQVESERALNDSREQLRHSEKLHAIGQLAGGIAHDFNNQLAAILGYADLMRDEVEHSDVLVEYAENIIAGINRASALTAQLLAFSRKGKYLSVSVDLHRVVFEVVSMLRHSIDKRVVVRQQLRASPSTTLGDPTQLQNAVLNLALNARDAMPQGGQLEIATDIVTFDSAFCQAAPEAIDPGRYVEVCVRDNGVGIEPDIIGRIFEPFFSTKSPERGTGMGLASVYGSAVSHRGAVRVESNVGQGSTFRLYLPVLDEDRVSTVAGPVENGNCIKTAARILFVEDEAMLCVVAERMLRKFGHAVTVCHNGKEAVELYESEWPRFDLVILDMVMPVMGGKDAYVAMRAINPKIVAILASGYSLDGDAQSIIDEGVMGFIQKPFRAAELSQKIEEVLVASAEG